MPKYTFEYLKNNKVAIETKTKEEWEKVVGKLLKWTTWTSGSKAIQSDLFRKNVSICLYCGEGEICFADTLHRIEFSIISAQEFLDDVNQPKKVRIIKEFEGLPPVGTIVKHTRNAVFSWEAETGSKQGLTNLEVKMALATGYAEEVKEEWRSFVPEFGDRYFFINTYGEVMEAKANINSYLDRNDFGNCFRTELQADLALEKIKEALKEAHKEINDNPTSN